MSNAMTNLPRDQRCNFLVGPMGTWFKPNTTDIWTQMRVHDDEKPDLSYFIYGSIGCFCYGEIYHRDRLSAVVNRLVDIKEDNSRIICVRFLKPSLYPWAMVLTESGSLLIHDCLSNEHLIHFKKSELINKLVPKEEPNIAEHCNKKPRFNVTQQIKSFVWPDARNLFVAITLPKKQTNLLIWLKLKDLTERGDSQDDQAAITKSNLIVAQEKLNLDLPEFFRQICCMESALRDSQTCIIAIGMDRGSITVVNVKFDQGQLSRIIKLNCHDADVCSMSLFINDIKKFPLGLLASVSRNGEMLIWDIENEFYFADFCLRTKFDQSSVDWFALSFVPIENSKSVNVVVSNIRNGITILRIPDNVRSKIRLKEIKDIKTKKGSTNTHVMNHQKLIFNMAYDPITATLLTSSHDANHILWRCSESSSKDGFQTEVKAHFMLPSMVDNSRTHMLRHSQIRESLLGVAMGKAGVAFYDIAKTIHNNRFDMTPARSMIARRILKESLSPTSISWHPSHEYRVAIGTLEGKVIRADLTPNKASLIINDTSQCTDTKPLKNTDSIDVDDSNDIFDVEYQPVAHEDCEKFSKTDGVYSLCWGPNPASPQDISRTAIYAIGSISHKLYIYHSLKDTNSKLTNYLDEFLDESLPEAIGEASEVSWKSSMELMALGTTTGKIFIVSYLDEAHADRSRNRLFMKLAVIQGCFGHSYIQCLAWHPTTDIEDPHYYQIAASANESPVFVVDLKESLLIADVKSRLRIHEGGDRFFVCSDASINKVTNHIYKLDSHKKAISDIVWNPHEPQQLATCSFDRQCLVWTLNEGGSAQTARVTSRFLGRNRLFTLEWSLVDTDLIYTSGHDSTIWAWRPSENGVSSDSPSM